MGHFHLSRLWFKVKKILYWYVTIQCVQITTFVFFQWNPVFIDFWQNFQWVMNMALCFVFKPFFYFACLIKTCGSIHAKFHVLVMSQSWDISFWTCYKKCVHTLSRLCHAVIPSIETRQKKLGKCALGMYWKSIKFCV